MPMERWNRWRAPVALLIAHTFLIEVASAVEMNGAWSDQNPTMLLLMAVSAVDAPVRMMIDRIVSWQDTPGTYLLLLKVLGGAFWFGVGWSGARLVDGLSAPRTTPA